MKDFFFRDKAKLAFKSPVPSKIIIRAASLGEAKDKLKKYIEIGIALGWYEDNRGA